MDSLERHVFVHLAAFAVFLHQSLGTILDCSPFAPLTVVIGNCQCKGELSTVAPSTMANQVHLYVTWLFHFIPTLPTCGLVPDTATEQQALCGCVLSDASALSPGVVSGQSWKH